MIKPLQTIWDYLILALPNIKNILRYPDGFEHNYGWKFEFRIPECFGKFLYHNNKLSSADIKKEASSSNQDGGIWKNTIKLL